MSQIEQIFSQFIAKRPEIEKCYSEGLVNRRALARYLIEKKVIPHSQFDAAIAMLRRFEFRKSKKEDFDVFKHLTLQLKDNLSIMAFTKEEDILTGFKKFIDSTEFGIGETLKMVVGTANITIIIDTKKIGLVKKNFRKEPKYTIEKISEMSLLFPDTVINTKGIISVISNEFYTHDILINEILTASSELLLYLKEDYVLKAYEVIKNLQAT
ncbi:MAG: hypothetical protein ABIJ34_00045 [archaeon]